MKPETRTKILIYLGIPLAFACFQLAGLLSAFGR